jgi:hypothetical protein
MNNHFNSFQFAAILPSLDPSLSPLKRFALGSAVCQVGKLSFFKSTVYRGSLCKFFSRGSILSKIKPPSC